MVVTAVAVLLVDGDGNLSSDDCLIDAIYNRLLTNIDVVSDFGDRLKV